MLNIPVLLGLSAGTSWLPTACTKNVPSTFADVLACVRHALWMQALPFSMSPATSNIRKHPQPLPEPLLAALYYSA